MEEVYVLLCDGACYEDLAIFLNKEDAITALNKIKNKSDNWRIEIFKKNNNHFIPSYDYILKSTD